jgi:hypothetical protein
MQRLLSTISRRRLKQASLVRCPVGGWTRTVSEFLFSKKTFEGVIEPLIADQAGEWSEATAQGRAWKARWIRVRYAYIFVLHLGAQAPLSVVKAVMEMWKLV